MLAVIKQPWQTFSYQILRGIDVVWKVFDCRRNVGFHLSIKSNQGLRVGWIPNEGMLSPKENRSMLTDRYDGILITSLRRWDEIQNS